MPVKTVTVIGATGLIGGHLVRLLQAESNIETIRIPVRRPVTISGPKLAINLIDFADPESFKLSIDDSDAVFCAVGTTQKKVKGNKEAYRKVDYDIPVNAARFCAETGCQHFLLVSSVGANSSSNNFYLQLKGEVEEAVQQQPIQQIAILRPSILLGNRAESRPAERMGQLAMQAMSFLLLGGLKKYKPAEAVDVAAAMVKMAQSDKRGKFILEYPFLL
jgi:uncharacterized protein YbjT (DUF2867 family)